MGEYTVSLTLIVNAENDETVADAFWKTALKDKYWLALQVDKNS